MTSPKTILISNNPFLLNTERPDVQVQRGLGPYKNTNAALSQIDLTAARGRRVLLKPNIGRMAAEDSGVVTNSQVVAAAIDAFCAAGAEVAIGESPLVGIKTMEAYEQCGLAMMARERECPLIDTDVRKPERCAIQEIKLCADVQDFDFIASVPVMKMHMHTVATLSIKNMKGCLWRRSKVDLHMLPPTPGHEHEKSLNMAIADMASVLRPHLAIIDGPIGMEGLSRSARWWSVRIHS